MSRVMKMILGVSLLLIVTIAILVVNAVRLPSRQLQVAPIDAARLDEAGAVERLSQALRFRTVSYANPEAFDPEPFIALRNYFEGAFPGVHAALERESVGGYSLLYRWSGSDASRRPILLMSHIDVVPVEAAVLDNWSHPPFGGVVADGFVWGRGALDTKGGTVGILEAVELLLGEGFQPTRDIYFAFGHDEEIGGAEGNARMAAILAERGVRLEYVLDEGGPLLENIIPGISAPVAFVAVAEKGYLGLEMTAHAPGGHSSMPPSETAIGELAAAIHALESNPLPAELGGATGLMLDYLGPEMSPAIRVVMANRWLFGPMIKRLFAETPSLNAVIRTTTAPTMIGGGVSRNVLPTSAWAVVNFRVLPGHTTEEVREYVRTTVNDDSVTYEGRGFTREPPRVSDPSSPAFQTLQRTIHEVFPDVVVAPGLTTVTTDSPRYESIAENTFRFIPFRATSEDLERIHGIDERISIENYLEIVRFFMRQIRNSASRETLDRRYGHVRNHGR